MATKSRQKVALAVDRPEVFLERERAVQRAGIVLLAIFVLAGALGVFGDGPLSHTQVTSGAVTVTFERFTRHAFRTEFEVEAAVATASGVEIRIDREFVDEIHIVEIRPAAALKRIDERAAIFEVPAIDGKASLQLLYEPKRYGVLRTAVSVGAQPAAHVRQIVFF